MKAKNIQQQFQSWLKKLNRILLRVFKNPFSCLVLVLALFLFFNESASADKNLLLAGFSQLDHSNKQKISFNQTDSVFSDLSQLVLEENSFRQTCPMSLVKTETMASLATESPSEIPGKKISEYLIQEGDTLISISQKFGISLDTLLLANDLNKSSLISPGKKLVILPVSGVMHLVKKGETLSQLSETYQAKANEISKFNSLSEKGDIFSGDILVIPGGKMPVRKYSKPAYTYQTPVASNYFICPIPSPCHITQGLHWYNAIDFSNGKCGEPVFASAGGIIQKTGYDSVLAGNYVRILHPNNVVTFYCHLSKFIVKSGQSISQGQIIGYIGHTGYTIGRTGCHVHFEVRGAKNPFAY